MSASPLPPSDEDLVFICGALRSGTTLLRLMINDHPLLSNPGEMDFLFEPPPVKGAKRDMGAYAHELAFNRVYTKLGLTIDPALTYEDQVRDFIRQLRAPGKKLSINIHRHFDRIPALFPKARFVRLLRDPRDVAKSSIGMGWAGNAYHGVDHWIASQCDFETLTSAVEPVRTHTLRYEDLLQRPREVLGALCAFLGVRYDEAMLNYPTHTTYGPPDPGLIDQWRTELAPRDIALVEGKLGDALQSCGYAPSGLTPTTPSALQRALLGASNRIGRWRFSARRNGLALTALDLAARRLPLRVLRDFTRRRLAAREARFLK